MAKFGGFNGGGAPNMQQLMRQAQKMQEDMAKAQEELAETEICMPFSNGLVEVTMTCDFKVSAIKIKPEVVDADDIETLEDLLVGAFNETIKAVEEEKSRVMGPVSGSAGGLF